MQCVVIAGPTGSGKSELAFRVANELHGEIVNYDSVQIYRGFDIGSAKPPLDQRETLPHHLFDIADATEEFTAAEYGERARAIEKEINARGRIAVFVGGTFFYLRAFLQGLPEMPGRDEALRRRIRAIAARPAGARRLHRWLTAVDPHAAAKIPAADRHRVERALEVWMLTGRPISSWHPASSSSGISAIQIALNIDRGDLNGRLDLRVETMYEAGLIDETRELLKRYPASSRPFGSIGYREAVAFLDGSMSKDDAVAQTKRRTRAYAKRQLTWLRSERNMHWIDAADAEGAFRQTMRTIEGER